MRTNKIANQAEHSLKQVVGKQMQKRAGPEWVNNLNGALLESLAELFFFLGRLTLLLSKVVKKNLKRKRGNAGNNKEVSSSESPDLDWKGKSLET